MLEIQGGNIERSGSFVEDRTIRGERRWRDESVVSLKFAPPSLLRACRRSRDPGPLSKFQRTLSARGGIRDEQSVYALYIYIYTNDSTVRALNDVASRCVPRFEMTVGLEFREN